MDVEDIPGAATFHGQVVLVTGAAHGFGRETCVQFAHRGAQVFALDVLAEELETTQSKVNEAARFGGGGQMYALDVTKESDIAACITHVLNKFGKIDVLVNNAGGVLGQVNKPVDEVTSEDWQRIVDVNLTGAFFMIRAVAAAMKAARYGRIVNVSSGAGRSYSLTGIQAYASAKAGQIGLTRQMAHELGPYNITVNNVAPGFVRSNAATEKQWQAMGADGQQRLIDAIALRKLGTTEDIANAILFFASDAARWVTGQIISVDGGHQMF